MSALSTNISTEPAKFNSSAPAVSHKVSDVSTVEEKPPYFEEGELIDDKFVIRKKIDEGGFGAIYKISPVNEQDKDFALKLALKKDEETDKVMRMEVGLLCKLSKLNQCIPKCYSTGSVDGHFYLVMDLLGLALPDVQYRMPDHKFTVATVIRIGLQIIDAIEAIHSYYFLHRDLKPSNMAIGLNDPRQIYLFDFGLARRYVQSIPGTKDVQIKPERVKAPFRGTYHYCSLQQHRSMDSCRRDDLWAFMYTLIEFISGKLPWEDEKDKDAIEVLKRETPISVLLKDCPPIFEMLLAYLDTLEYLDQPSYDMFRNTFNFILMELKVTEDGPYDWEIHSIDDGETEYATTTKESAETGYTTTTKESAETGYTTEFSDMPSTDYASTNYMETEDSSIGSSLLTKFSNLSFDSTMDTSSTEFSSIFTSFSESSVSALQD